MPVLHITAGESMNNDLKKKFKNCVPFNESILSGIPFHHPFDDDFILERSALHSCTIADYHKKMDRFIRAFSRLENYEEVHLWFGTEPFCNANRNFVLGLLKERNYKGKIFFHAMDEKEQNEVSVTPVSL